MSEGKLDSNKDAGADNRVRTPKEIAQFSDCENWMLRISYSVLCLCYSIILIQILHCVPNKIGCFLSSLGFLCSPNPWLTYIALILSLFAWLVHFIIWHKRTVYHFRLEDPSEVRALIIEANTVKKRLTDNPVKPAQFKDKKLELENEVQRLKHLGDENWLDYEILTLNVMLVDFLKPDDLKARARASLEDLQDHCENRVDRLEKDFYNRWSKRIKEGCDKIDEIEKGKNEVEKDFQRRRDDAARQLRADLRMLLERLSDYDEHWAIGSAVITAIMKYGVTTIPHLLGIGLLPLFYGSLGGNLLIHNMAVLGACGSITAVLQNLYKRYGSDEAEVGATKGRTQLWLSILGASLGLVAGIVFYAMVRGELLEGALFPSFPPKDQALDVAKAIIWGIASGYSFELIFNRMGSISSQEM